MVVIAPLVGLGTFALVMWVIATALAIAVIMGYIAGVLHGLPYPINQLAGPVSSLAQGISHAAGKLEAGVDHLIGASWHALARYMDHLWHHTVWSAHVLAQTAESLARLFYAHAHLRALVHKAVGTAEAFIPRIKTLEREWHGIEHRVKSLEREIAKGIGHDLRIEVKALERTIGRVEHKVIPAIRSIADTAEAEVTSLRKWVTDHTLVAGTAAFAGAVAWALSSLGLGWLRCNSNPFNNNKRACGLWGDLAGLLALGTAAELALHVDEIVKIIEELTPAAVAVMNKAK